MSPFNVVRLKCQVGTPRRHNVIIFKSIIKVNGLEVFFMKDYYDSLLDTIEQKKGLWSEKKRSGSVVRSNKAHDRLVQKAIKRNDFGLMWYHNDVARTQFEENRVLSRSERKNIYKKYKK